MSDFVKKSIDRKVVKTETLEDGRTQQTLECDHTLIVKTESDRHKKRETTHRPCRLCVLEGRDL